MTAIELSSYFGLAAMTLLTLNILIGLVMSVKYNPVRNWPHRRVNTFKIHNWTAYIALSIAAIHPVILLFSSTAKFTLVLSPSSS
jgi:predicted ferric reductase